MNRYERFAARLTASIALGVTLALVALFLVIDFGDWLRLYTGKPVIDVITLYWFRSHLAFVQLAPAAIVVSASLAITVVRRRNEYTALRALGASPRVLLLPVTLVSAAFALSVVAVQEWVVSRSGPAADRIMVERFDRWGDYLAVYSPKRWFKAGRSLVNVRGQADRGALTEVRIFELDAQGALVRWREGARLEPIKEGTWRLTDSTTMTLGREPSNLEAAPSVELDLPLAREVSELAIGRPEWLPLSVLARQVPLLRTLELPTEATRYAVHQRLSAMVATVLAALVAALLALRSRARPSIPRALMEGAALFGGLFVGGMLTRGLATSGRLVAEGAAWVLPAIVLAAAVAAARSLER